MAKNLEGRVALITGASSGIGAATALSLAGAGARVALAARRIERLEELVARVRHWGGEATAIQADVARQAAAEQMVATTVERFGKLDILVNNAGIGPLAEFAASDPEDWRRTIGVNLLGLFYSTRAALPHLKRAGGGQIVNLSSVAGRMGFPNGAVYSATKFGVVGFSDALRRETLGQKTRITVIEPGAVATEFVDHTVDQASKARIQAWQATMRQLQPEDIAAAILYAVSQPDSVCVNEILLRPTDQEF
jgi:NADP-dependent 3-hydroxy acid dehydrogenase YdfG